MQFISIPFVKHHVQVYNYVKSHEMGDNVKKSKRKGPNIIISDNIIKTSNVSFQNALTVI